MDSIIHCLADSVNSANHNKDSQTTDCSINAPIKSEINIRDPTLSQVKGFHDVLVEGIMADRDKITGSAQGKLSMGLRKPNPKLKLEKEDVIAAKIEPRVTEPANPMVAQPMQRISLKTILEVETKLVYVDEQNIAYEFENPMSVASLPSASAGLETANFCLRPPLDKWLQVSLKEASTSYKQKKYAIAAGRFRTALELCSKGAALGTCFDASAEDISSVASFIESKLVTCYLRMRRADLALNHAHRSVTLNPAYFRNHLRQAAVFRLLERYSEAARSAMVADYMLWLSGGGDRRTSQLIKVYWQAMFEEAITRTETFSVMYTPFATKLKEDRVEKVKEAFAKQHPGYVEYVYTDPQVLHLLPQTTNWTVPTSQNYLLTLGFKSKEDGHFLEKISNRKLPTFIEHKFPFRPFTKGETEKHLQNFAKRVLPILDLIRCTKLPGSFCACSGVVEKLQYASFLSRVQRVKEEAEVLHQALAELSTIPYLQDISQQDAELLQSLMADAMDTLDGKASDGERAWNAMQKVGLIEDFIYQLEESYLKNKKLRSAQRQRTKLKRLERAQLCQSLGKKSQSPPQTQAGKAEGH